MPEIPSSQPDEKAEYALQLQRWIDTIEYAAGGICGRTGLVVLIDYKKGVLTPDVSPDELTASQRAEIERWRQGLPDLTINFHR